MKKIILEKIFNKLKSLNYEFVNNVSIPYIKVADLQISGFIITENELKYNYDFIFPVKAQTGKILKMTLNELLMYLEKWSEII